jgi:trehalose 6-phosphate synthase/phosphatase
VCERLLGLTIQPDRVDNGGVYVQVRIYPFGIDTESFKNAMNKSSVRKMRDDLKASLAGKRIIVGVDRLDYIKGIPNKLLGIEHFLETYPEWRGRVVVLQVATPSRTASEEYQTFRSEVLEMVGRINGRFGTLEDMPIHYREHTLTFEELCALYSVADVAVLTSLRDGMNLVSYEYVMCQKEHHGALVLSEFTGAAHNLPGALLVNPWNIDEVGNAIHNALEMTDLDRELKHHKMYGYVMLNTSAAWGVHFIDDLVRHAASRRNAVAKLVLLPADDVVRAYRAAKCRLLMLDYDGTLRKYESQPELAEPSEHLRQLLTRLAGDPANVVFIITGRQKATMMEWFGAAGIGFAVEHGFSIRWPDHLRDKFGVRMATARASAPASSPSISSSPEDASAPQLHDAFRQAHSTPSASPPGSPTLRVASSVSAAAAAAADRDGGYDEWDSMLGPTDLELMRTTLHRASALLRRIEAYTPASFISVKESALTWHFRDADPDFAYSAAQDARQALDEVLFNSPMEVLMGSEAIHVRPRGVHKGAAAREIGDRLAQGGWEPDWVLAIGDDRTDEEMFEAARCAGGATTVTVGRKTTKAHFFVPGVDHVISLLEAFADARAGSDPTPGDELAASAIN